MRQSENFHQRISEGFKPRELESMWKEMTKGAQEKIQGQLKQMGYETEKMSAQEIMHEYLAEGLTNESLYAMPGGLKLETKHLEEAKAKEIKIPKVQEAPEIKEVIDDKKSLVKLARKNKMRNIARAAAEKIMPWRKKKEVVEEEVPEKTPEELIEEYYHQIERDDEMAELKSKNWGSARKLRKLKEEMYKEAQKRRDKKVIAFNKEITDYEDKAKEAAKAGRTAEVREFKDKAAETREKAGAEDERLKPVKEAFEKSKTEEGKTQAEAQAATTKSEESHKKMAEAIGKRTEDIKGGKDKYDKFIDESVKKGVESFEGSFEKYRDELERKIGESKMNFGKVPFAMEIDRRTDVHNWQEELKKVEESLAAEKPEVKVEAEVEAKVLEEKIKIPAEIKPNMNEAEVMKLIKKLTGVEEEADEAQENAESKGKGIDPKVFNDIFKEMDRSLTSFSDTIRESAKEFRNSDKVNDFLEKAVDPLRNRMATQGPPTAYTRHQQFELLQEFRRLTLALKERETKRGVPTESLRTRGEEAFGGRGRREPPEPKRGDKEDREAV